MLAMRPSMVTPLPHPQSSHSRACFQCGSRTCPHAPASSPPRHFVLYRALCIYPNVSKR